MPGIPGKDRLTKAARKATKSVQTGVRTTVSTVYEESGAKDAVQGVRKDLEKVDRKVFGNQGLRDNIKRLKKDIRTGGRGY